MTSLAASASGGLLAATNSAGELCVWGAAYGAMLARVAIPTGAETTAVSFVTDSQVNLEVLPESGTTGKRCWRSSSGAE